jgi:mercuric ion transport protein
MATLPRSMSSAPSAGDRAILRVGIGGSIVAALCCFTPILAVALGAIGLSAWLGWADYVLFPALALFLGLAGYGFYRVRQHSGAAWTCCAPGKEPEASGRS